MELDSALWYELRFPSIPNFLRLVKSLKPFSIQVSDPKHNVWRFLKLLSCGCPSAKQKGACKCLNSSKFQIASGKMQSEVIDRISRFERFLMNEKRLLVLANVEIFKYLKLLT